MKTKLITKKKLTMLLCILLALTLAIAMTIPNMGTLAASAREALPLDVDYSIVSVDDNNASVLTEQHIQRPVLSQRDIGDFIGVNPEQHLQILENDLAQQNTDVITRFNERIEDFKNMQAESECSEEIAKIQSMINATLDLIAHTNLVQSGEFAKQYSFNRTQTLEQNSSTQNSNSRLCWLPYMPPEYFLAAIFAAKTYFSLMGYDLSFELLNRAMQVAINPSLADIVYYPVFGHRVKSSPLTHNIARGRAVAGGYSHTGVQLGFPHSGELITRIPDTLFGNYVQDIYYGIRHFDFTKPNGPDSRIIDIRDIFSFGPEEFRTDGDVDLQGFAYEHLYWAEVHHGLIRKFNVRIIVDMSFHLAVRIIDGQNVFSGFGSYLVEIENFSNNPVNVILNTRMANRNDARSWTNWLNHLYTFRLPPGGVTRAIIQENLTATHLAIAKVVGDTLRITYVDGLRLSFVLNNRAYPARGNVNTRIMGIRNYGGNVAALGRNSIMAGTGTWFLNVTNSFRERKRVEFNSRMAWQGDARNWTNLSHVVNLGYLNPGESRIIRIDENLLAATLAIRFIAETEVIIRYANNLSNNGVHSTMSVNTNVMPIFRHLHLTNSGRSGNYWLINITNPLSNGVWVYYNARLAWTPDARNWTFLLSHINRVWVNGGQTVQVRVRTNLLAPAFPASYFAHGRRVVSYATGLNANGAISVGHNIV